MAAAAPQLRHALGFLTMLGAVLAKLAVCRNRAGTTGMGALLRLVHDASCSDTREHCRTAPPVWRTWRAGLKLGCSVGSGAFGLGSPRVPLALRSQNAAPVFMFGYRHPALDTDTDPLTWLGLARKELFQNRHELSRFQLLPETEIGVRRFAEPPMKRLEGCRRGRIIRHGPTGPGLPAGGHRSV